MVTNTLKKSGENVNLSVYPSTNTAVPLGFTARRSSGGFALRHVDGCHYVFGWTSKALAQLSGRALRDHDFLSLWCRADRAVIRHALDDVRRFARPHGVQAIATTHCGQTLSFMLTFSQLSPQKWGGNVLGCRWQAEGTTSPGTPIKHLALAG